MIFFDIDNTLVDYNASEKNAIETLIFSEFKIKMNLEQTAFWHEISNIYFQKYLSNELSFEQQGMARMEQLSAFLKADSKASDAKKLFAEYQKLLSNNWILFDDVMPALEKLKGRRLGIISNGNREQQINRLECTNISDYFEIQIYSGEFGKAKPAHEIFLHAAELSGEPIDQMVYVGDNTRTDIIPCVELGIKCVHVNRDYGNLEKLLEKIQTEQLYLQEKYRLPQFNKTFL